MRVHSGTKILNALIGSTWAATGSVLFILSLLWLLRPLLSRLLGASMPDIEGPDSTTDYLLIAGGLFMSLFTFAWSAAMLRRKEWGALAGGIQRLAIIAYLLAAFPVLFRASQEWLSIMGLDAYDRYVWLVWTGWGLVLLWLLITIFFHLVSPNRREFYAQAHVHSPAPAIATCPQCGLILDNGLCPVHDRRTRTAYLRIGNRRELLPFTETDTAFVVGRQKDVNEAFITLSDLDTEHPDRVSSRHLMIQYHFDYEQFTIRDLASLNKSYLNDNPEPLSPSQDYPLLDGDRINLAKEITLVFEAGDKGSQV